MGLESSVLSGFVRNFYGVSLLLVLSLVAAACGSEPNLIAGEQTKETQPSVQSVAAVADDSAPFEVVPDAGAFIESTDALDTNDHPLLRYLEPNTNDSQHPGNARFVLFDSAGEPARRGSAQFPLAVISIGGLAGENTPIEYVLFYNNFNQNEFGEIGYGRCRGAGGHFIQRSATSYDFRSGQYPNVKDLGFDEHSADCGEMPPLTPANIFDGTVELEFADTDLTVVSQTGERWAFRQIPLRSERQRLADAQPTTTAAATTTTVAPEPEPNPCLQSLSFLGEVDDPAARGAYPESVLEIRDLSAITVLGRITAVEPGPTHAWVPERIEVPADDPRAKVQMLHFTLDVDRAHPSSATIGQSVQFAVGFAPGTDHEPIEVSATTGCELVVFIFDGPVTNYDSSVWSSAFDGGAIGVVNGGRVEFPNAYEYIETLPTITVEELFS